MTLELPKQVKQVLSRLNDYGYSAYIHGECVRLLIKGQTPNGVPETPMDFDIMTNAEFPRLRAIFDHEDFHTVQNAENVLIRSLYQSNELIVTVLGVAVSVTSYVNLEFELARRHGFTFDAIAYSAVKGLFDPFNGAEALDKGELLFISDCGNVSGIPEFNPHDIMPALAWLATEEFTVPEKSKRLIIRHSDKAFCLREDLEKVLMGRNVKVVFGEFREVFTVAIPELKMLDSELLTYTFKCVGASSPLLTLRYALLFHELGKPDCESQMWDDERVYPGQAERARIYAQRIMRRLHCSLDDILDVEYIIKNRERIADITEDNILDFADTHSRERLKLMLLFNSACFRANEDEKTSQMYKKLSKLI
jgi:tRNA nucleotidyltransferase (CCA-adding enzyme)